MSTEKVEAQKTETVPEKPYSEKTWIEKFLTPGVGMPMINMLRGCFVLLMVFLMILILFSYNIHYVIMSILTLCLFLSFEYFIAQLIKYDLLNPEETKELREKEAAAKKAEEEKKEKKD